jgi:esterase/lipase superfamily enzyme
VNGVAVYGNWGRPVLAFPAERGDAGEFERHGMVDSIGGLLEAARVELYCVDSFDRETWSNDAIPLEERGDAAYFNNPLDYVTHLDGDHLEWLRDRLSLLLVCGQGQWEDTTGALESTRAFASVVTDEGIRCELDLWGYDVPHDWPSWRAQLAHHPPRFC